MADDQDREARRPHRPTPDSDPRTSEQSTRPKRASVRPSAFGPPRGTGAGAPLPVAEPRRSDDFAEDSSDSLDELDPYELTPSSSPTALELVTKGLFSGESSADSSDGWTPLGTRQNVFPTLGYDPFRGPDSQPSPPGRDLDSEEVSVPSFPGRGEFEEKEVTSPSLVAARSGLLPIPEGPAEGDAPETPEESSVGTLSVALFVLMFLGAGGVLVAQWPRDEAAPSVAPPIVSVRSQASALPPSSAHPPRAAQVAAPPPMAVETPAEILAKVEPGLPEDAGAAARKLLAYAGSYLEDGRPEVADALLARALEADERNGDVWLALGRLSLLSGELEQAEERAGRAVGLSPGNPDARVLLGDVYARQGKPAKARRHWRRALRVEPESEAAAERLEAE